MSNSDDSENGGGNPRDRNSTLRGRPSSSRITRGESVSQSIELEGTGVAQGLDDLDGFRQPTAMFDRGEFLGELGAELNESPETRVKVEAESPPRGFRLIVVAGPGLGTEWAFKQAEITIGRSAENEIDFADIAVSRQHTRIVFKNEHYILLDLGSNNGTLLNGISVSEERLHSGDEIIIGERTLRFVELNEVPLTSAAQANIEHVDVQDDQEQGEALEVSDDSEEDGLNSQLNVNVVPNYDGPSESDSVSEAIISVVKPRPRRTGLKVIGIISLALVSAIVIGFMSLRAYQNYTGTTREDRLNQAAIYFLQAVELTKARRCGDALILLDEVLSVRPEYSRAKEYRTYCTQEIATFKDIQDAKRLKTEGDSAQAIAMLSKIPKDSQYAVSVDSLRTQWTRVDHTNQLRNANSALEKKKYLLALEILDDVLKQSPANKKALSLKKRALALKTSDSEVKVSPTKDIPSALTRSVRLYREGKVTQAIDAVELARSEKAARYVERLKTMQILLPELKQAHRQKAGSDIVRLSPKLLSLDRKLGYGQGVIRPKLSRYYADGLYLKGLEAYSDGSFEKAYQLFRKAVQMQSSHKLSRSYLETLNRKARVLYYEAYVLKDTDKNAASKAFQQVIGMTPSSNQFHKLAKKWLRSQ